MENEENEEVNENKEEIEESITKEEETEAELEEEKEIIENISENMGNTKHTSSETAQELDESKELENLRKVEAALFISGRLLSLQELVMLTDINPLMLKELIEKLTEKYNSEESGLEIVEKAGSWKMDVRQEHVHMINKLATGNSEFTKAEQETLAVIAYKQPVKQSVIINIRGNKAYDHIKKFLDSGLLIGKRVGHTKELKLSDDFHEYFHIREKDFENEKNDGSEETEEDNSGEEVEESKPNVEGE